MLEWRHTVMAYRTYETAHTTGRKVNRNTYDSIQGNTVRRLNAAEEIQAPSSPRELSRNTRKNRDKALYMNLGYVLFLAAALISAAIILIGYIRIQSEITLSVKHIAVLESELNSLRLSNDEDYSRIESSVDLEEIRRVAIGELGMRYAREGQIINVSGEGSDYVRQLKEIEN